MKKQVLSAVLGLAMAAAAGSAFAAEPNKSIETLEQGAVLDQIVQDKVLSVTEDENFTFGGEGEKKYTALGKNDELTGNIVEDKVRNPEETEENNAPESYTALGENDELTGNIIEDKVLNPKSTNFTEKDAVIDGYTILVENDKLSGTVVKDKVINIK